MEKEERKLDSWNEDHLKRLKVIGQDDTGYIGSNSLKWAKFVLPKKEFDLKLDNRFTRDKLFDYCKDFNNDNLNVLVAILSWGGMHRSNGKILFENHKTVLDLVEKLRTKKYNTREEAFLDFYNKRVQNDLPGLGIGYYTKLICFLSPHLNGYIMDQWAGKSINLLLNRKIVGLTAEWVSEDRNDVNTYKEFCTKIDELSKILECDGFEAEKRIFSVGNGKGLWRNYLKENYKKNIF